MEMSTKKELVLKVFNNEEAERIPVLFTHHYLAPEELNDGLNNKTLLQKNLDGAREFKKLFDPDIVKIMTDGYFFLPYDYSSIRTVQDLKKIQPLDENGEWFEKNVELVKGYREIYGDDILVFYNIFAPLTQLRNGVQLNFASVPGADPVLEFIKEDAKAVEEALDVIASDIVKFLPRVIKEGLSDGIYLSVTNPNRQIPADIYSTFISPSEKKILAAAKALAPNNILHICGYEGNKNIISVYKDYDVKVINWAVHAEQFGLKEGKELFGGRAVIGGFDNTKNSILYNGSREEIENYVEKLISEVGKTGVVIGADCTVPADIDIDRLNWARQKAKDLS
jgi:uroporphyrinogen decarboxylase